MGFDLFSQLELEARETDTEFKKALALSRVRSSARFGAFLNEATTNDEFNGRLDHVTDEIERIAREASEEIGTDDVVRVYDTTIRLLRSAAGIEDMPSEGGPVAMPDPPNDLAHMMLLHQDASPEAQAQLQQFYQLTQGQGQNPTLDEQMQPGYYDQPNVHDEPARRAGVAPREYYAKDDDDKEKDKKGDPKKRACPTCKASPGSDCKSMDINDQIGKGKEKFHDARKKGRGEGATPQVKLMHAFRQFVADQNDGDSYERDTIDLNAEKATNETSEPEPKIDRNRVPEDGLPAIDVPSQRHPTEQQSVLDVVDYNNDDRNLETPVSEIRNPQEPWSEELNGSGQSAVFPNRNQAQPVTSGASPDGRYHEPTADMNPGYSGDNLRAQFGLPPTSTDIQSPATQAYNELIRRGMNPNDASEVVNKFMKDAPAKSEFPDEDDPFDHGSQPPNGLDQEDLRSMHTVGSTPKWRVL